MKKYLLFFLSLFLSGSLYADVQPLNLPEQILAPVGQVFAVDSKTTVNQEQHEEALRIAEGKMNPDANSNVITDYVESEDAVGMTRELKPMSDVLATLSTSNIRNLAPQRKTSFTFPETGLFLIAKDYSVTGSTLVSHISITNDGTNYIISDVYGLSSVTGFIAPTITIDAENGTVSIPAQEVLNSTTYGHLWMVPMRITDTGSYAYSKEPITGTIDDKGNITLGMWGVLIPLDTDINPGRIFNVFTSSDWKACNMSYVSTLKAGTTVEGIGLIEQNSDNEIVFYNLGGNNYGDVLYATIYPNKTAKMSPQKVYSNAYGDFYCYSTDSDYKINTELPISITATDTGLLIDYWALACRGTTSLVARNYQNTVITTDFVITWPTDKEISFDGEGTAANPYKIKTTDDMALLAQAVNNGQAPYNSACYQLENDLDFTGAKYTVIGYNSATFDGTFDGQNHTISNLTITGRAFNVTGLFGETTDGSTIKNLNIKNIKITNDGQYTGCLAGINRSTVENVNVEGTLTSTGMYAGGIAGLNYGKIEGCTFNGYVSSYGETGGIVGYNYGPILKCHTEGSFSLNGVINTTFRDLAGIAGYCVNNKNNIYTASISDCYVSGIIVDNYGTARTGGIVGTLTNSTAERCFNTASISAQRVDGSDTDTYTGGIVAYGLNAKILNCYNAGTIVKSGTSSGAGGILGFMLVVYVTSAGSTNIGNITYIENCYNSAQIISSEKVGTKGVYGTANFYLDYDPIKEGVSNTYTDSQINGYPSEFDMTTADLTSGQLPEGFDSSIWEAKAGYYPTLKGLNDNAAAQLSASALMPSDLETLLKVKKPLTVSSQGDVVWKLYDNSSFVDDTEAMSLSGNTISIKDKYATAIVTAKQSATSAFFKMYRVAVVPKVFEGEGTAESPYLIRNVADFKQLNEAVTTYAQPHAGDYFRMTNDIDFADSDFAGIGAKYTPSVCFGGVFDGDNHYIHNFKIAAVAYDSNGLAVTDGSYRYTGFFNAILDSSVVKNLNIASDCSFTHWGYSGNLVGWNMGRVENCRNYASATCIASFLGGLVGYNAGTITGCYNAGDMTAGYSYAGGLAGVNAGNIELSENDANIKGAYVNDYSNTAQSYVGGITGGITAGATIDRCINNGNVTAYTEVGGIVGYSEGGTITNNISTGMVSALNEDIYRGAIIGYRNTAEKVENNYYDSSVILYQAANSAGMLGATGLSTTSLTSGTILAGLDADDWSFTAGAYPALKKFADEPLSKLMRAIYINFGDNESLANVAKDVDLSSDSRITWKLDSSSAEDQSTVYFSVSNGKLHVSSPTGMQIGTDGLTATIEGNSKYFPLQIVPIIFDGAGTEANPYQIKSVLDLHNLSEFIYNTGYNYANAFFKVMNDIDYAQADSTTLNPIAKGGTVEFSGIFDGNGKTIKGFTYENISITNTTSKPHPLGYVGRNLGFFGKVGSLGVIKNLTLDGQITLYSFAGGLVGDLYGRVENCTVKSTIATSNLGSSGGIASRVFSGGAINNCVFEGVINSKTTYCGGIAYLLSEGAEINNCINKGTINGTSYMGGIVGNCSGIVRNCENSADATFSVSSYIGGIASTLNTTGQIYDCVNRKDLVASAASYTYYGGIVAAGTTKSVGAIIKNCTNYGTITSKQYNGGIIGRNYKGTTVEDCINYGDVTSTGSSYCGGIASYSETSDDTYPTLIKGCTNYGNIKGYTSYVAGIMGYIASNVAVEDCANFGNISLPEGASNMFGVGGVVGYCAGSVKRSFNYGDVSSICHGTGGVVGNTASGTIDQCFNAGNISSTLAKYEGTTTTVNGAVGGIVAYSSTKAAITNCYNLGDLTSPKNVAGLIARATATTNSTTNFVTLKNCYNAGKVNITGDDEDPISANLYVRTTGTTVEWENIYYDSDINTGTYGYDPKNRGRSTADLMDVELGDEYVHNRATLPILSIFADNQYACLPAIRVLFTKEGDSAKSVNDNFYVGMPCDDLVYTTSENLRMSTSNPGLVYPLSIGEGWIKVATSDGKYSRQFDVIVNSTSAVSELDGKAVVDTIYYDLQGSRVYNPAPGAICIVKTVYDDGTSYTNKQVVR